MRPEKEEFGEYVKSTGMFFVDNSFEDNIEQDVKLAVDTLCEKMRGIFAEGGLEEYIRSDEDALSNLISLMNISSEKFKRVVTMLRIEKGHSITGEWDLKKIRTMMIERPLFMQEICDLLRNGANNPKYQGLIPSFYLENFVIDASTMARLSNPDDLRRLVKKGIEGRYNNGIGDAYLEAIRKSIGKMCFDEGLTFVCNKTVPLIGRVAHFAIPNEYHPRIIVDVSYNITTSSAQTHYKEQEEAAAKAIRNYNATNAENEVILINVLDGAGWVARQADFRAIHRCSTYALHLSKLNELKKIFQYYT